MKKLFILAVMLLILPSIAFGYDTVFYEKSGLDNMMSFSDVAERVIYGEFKGSPDYFVFSATDGDLIRVEMTVPADEAFNPSFAFLIEGSELAPEFVHPYPEGFGGAIVHWTTNNGVDDDFFTQTTYRIGQFATYNISGERRIMIVVYDKNGTPGKYRLVLGNNERDVGGLIAVPYDWARVRMWLGDSTPIYVLALFGVVFGFMSGKLLFKKLKKKDTESPVTEVLETEVESADVPPTNESDV